MRRLLAGLVLGGALALGALLVVAAAPGPASADHLGDGCQAHCGEEIPGQTVSVVARLNIPGNELPPNPIHGEIVSAVARTLLPPNPVHVENPAP